MEDIEKKRLRHVSKLAFEISGKNNQLRQLQEECAKLIVAINHYFTDLDPDLEETTEKIADMLIIINQIIIGIETHNAIAHQINTKTQRLEKKLNDIWQSSK